MISTYSVAFLSETECHSSVPARSIDGKFTSFLADSPTRIKQAVSGIAIQSHP